MHRLAEKTEVPIVNFVAWLGIARAKFYAWRSRYGKANEHNGKIPRDHWIELWERQAIIDYFDQHPLEGYRRLTFMMLDDDIVAVSPATVYRVLRRGADRDGARHVSPAYRTGAPIVVRAQPGGAMSALATDGIGYLFGLTDDARLVGDAGPVRLELSAAVAGEGSR